MKILHFADAHIDTNRSGKKDPATGLPERSIDYINALDKIIETAINEKVKMVLFSGDTYRSHTTIPVYQKIWETRIRKLSDNGIFTILLTGNHDISPSITSPSSMQEFETLGIANVILIDKPTILYPGQLNGLPVQIIGIPYIQKSQLLRNFKDSQNVNLDFENVLMELINKFIESLNPEIPTIAMGHFSIQGATFSSEQIIRFGADIVINKALFQSDLIDYVALGHIHKFQNVNEGKYPAMIYSGSIEKNDFGEINDDKGFIMVDLERCKTTYEFRKLEGREYIDLEAELTDTIEIKDFMDSIKTINGKNAIIRIRIKCNEEINSLIDSREIRKIFDDSFELYLEININHYVRDSIHLDSSQFNDPEYLLNQYWNSTKQENKDELLKLAKQIINACNQGIKPDEFINNTEAVND